jgi:uncharacterized protein YbjT (DUF2867 family)
MILITGGTGFIGSHLIKRMRQEGIPVRALVRNPDKSRALEDLGVEVIKGEMSDTVSLEKATSGAERVIHLVGIIQEAPGATFQQVVVDGTRSLLEAAKKSGVRHFFYQSALGTRPNARSEYHKAKWAAEELVRAGGIPYTILRPSLIYGPGDQFTIRLSQTIRLSPFLPIIGSGRSRVQPLYIDDATACIVKAVTNDCCLNEICEIGGPDQLTYEEVTYAIADAMGVDRPALHLPFFFMKPMAAVFKALLPNPPVTADQLIMLQEDTICSLRDIRDAFGIEPIGFLEGLKRFIRPVSHTDAVSRG